MMAGLVSLVLMIVVSLLSSGCASRPPAGKVRPAADAPYLIFNPDFTAVPPVFIGRSDWPATPYDAGLGEDEAYQVRIIDHQGGFHPRHDYLNRRFYSVRSGRMVR